MRSKEESMTGYNRHLKAAQPRAEETQFKREKDAAPTFAGSVLRVRGGRKRSTPVVAQKGFDLEGDPLVEFQTLTDGRLKRLTPIEEEVRQSTQGFIDPETSKKATQQRKAIERKSARK